MGDGAWIPREQGKTMKEVLDAILQECKRTRDVPPHVTTGLLYLTGPEIEVEMDIEPSAYLQTSTGNDPDASTLITRTITRSELRTWLQKPS